MLSVKAEQPLVKRKPTTMNVQSIDDDDDDDDNMGVDRVGFRGLDVVLLLVVFVLAVVKSKFFWGMWMDPRGRKREKKNRNCVVLEYGQRRNKQKAGLSSNS